MFRGQMPAVRVLVALIASALAGCGFIPTSGPTTQAIEAQAPSTLPYLLVPLTPAVVDILSHNEPPGLAGAFTDRRRPSDLKFGIGDVISVTIFEAAAGGLFIPSEAGVRPGNFVTIPDQAVDNDGNISVPYAGIIRANGKTNVQVQNEIVSRIKNRAIEPQVVVALSSQRTNLVSVFGEVNAPIRFAASASGAGDRITDALTRAAGIKGQGFETWIVLERANKRATVPFENLVMNPANNIYIQPGDRIYAYREQQKFIAFGASGRQGEFNFDAWRINLTEGIAKAGGLVDFQANPGSVFLYRREPNDIAVLLGADTTKLSVNGTVPVIFKVDMSDPAGYFVATKLLMRNQDVIFAANAKEVEVTKFLTFVNLVTATAGNGLIATSTARAIR